MDGLNSISGLYEEIMGIPENRHEEIIQNEPCGKHESEDTKNRKRRHFKKWLELWREEQNEQGRDNIWRENGREASRIMKNLKPSGVIYNKAL